MNSQVAILTVKPLLIILCSLKWKKQTKNKHTSFTRHVLRVPPVLCVVIPFNHQVALPLHKLRRQEALRQAPAQGCVLVFPECKLETHPLPGFSSSPGRGLTRSWVKGGLEGEFLEEEEVSQFIHGWLDDKNDWLIGRRLPSNALWYQTERGKKKWSLFVQAARQTWADNR